MAPRVRPVRRRAGAAATGTSVSRRPAATSSTQPKSATASDQQGDDHHEPPADADRAAHRQAVRLADLGDRHDDRHVPEIDGQRPGVEDGDQPRRAGGRGGRGEAERDQDERGGPERVAERDVVEVVPAGPGMGEDPGGAERRGHGGEAEEPARGQPAQHAVVVGEAEQPRAAVEGHVAHDGVRGEAQQGDDRQRGVRASPGPAREAPEDRQGQRRQQHEPEEVPQVPGGAQRHRAPAVGRRVLQREGPVEDLPVPGEPGEQHRRHGDRGQHPQRRQQAAQPALDRERPGRSSEAAISEPASANITDIAGKTMVSATHPVEW